MNSYKRALLHVMGLWQPLLGFAVGIGTAVGLLLFKLGTLVPALSSPEVQSLANSQTVDQLVKNPLNLPYKAIVLGLNIWGQVTPFSLRAVSVLFGLVAIGLFYYTLRQWYAERTAILGTALFATSSWFLHAARLAEPSILYAMLVGALAYGTWIRKTQRSFLAILFGGALSTFLLYIPGLVWFVVIGGFWQRKALLKHYKHHALAGFLVVVLSGMFILPLLYGLALDPTQIKTWLGLQASGIPQPLVILHDFAAIPYHLFLHAPADPARWLGTVPLLDVFAIAMSLLGVYAYYFMKGLDRAKMLFSAGVISCILIGFGVVNTIVLLPFVYIFVAAGIALMLQQWFTVFPRNPLARLIGTTLMSVVVVMAVFYHVNRYYIAWPNSPKTKQAFQIHL